MLVVAVVVVVVVVVVDVVEVVSRHRSSLTLQKISKRSNVAIIG